METKKIRNDLLKRQEISFNLEADKNPSFGEMRKKISEDFKKNEEVIDVYKIKGSFGSRKFKIDAYIYDSKEDLEKSTKKQKEAEAKGAEQPAEEVKKAKDSDKKEPASEVKSEA